MNHGPAAARERKETPRFQRFGFKGLQNQANQPFLVSMKYDPAKIRKDVAAHRERRKAAGRIFVNTDLPGDLVAAIDQLKEARGVRGRTPIIEEALRVYIETQQGT